MSRATREILTELRQFKSEMHEFKTEMRDFRADTRADMRHLSERIDGTNARLDTVIDSIADLRTDFERHTHG